MRDLFAYIFAAGAVGLFAYCVAAELRPRDEPGYVAALFVCVFLACALGAGPRR